MIGFGTGITECPEHHTLYSVARICLICVAEHVLAHRGGFAAYADLLIRLHFERFRNTTSGRRNWPSMPQLCPLY